VRKGPQGLARGLLEQHPRESDRDGEKVLLCYKNFSSQRLWQEGRREGRNVALDAITQSFPNICHA
jgi:hypothetical protein